MTSQKSHGGVIPECSALGSCWACSSKAGSVSCLSCNLSARNIPLVQHFSESCSETACCLCVFLDVESLPYPVNWWGGLLNVDKCLSPGLLHVYLALSLGFCSYDQHLSYISSGSCLRTHLSRDWQWAGSGGVHHVGFSVLISAAMRLLQKPWAEG